MQPGKNIDSSDVPASDVADPLEDTDSHQNQQAPSAGAVEEIPEEDSPWNYASHSDESTLTEPVKWSASEYIDHDKSVIWYLAVGSVAIVLAGLVYLLTRDLINGSVILIVASLFAVAGARKPRTLDYELDGAGIRVGAKFFNYAGFKSFAIMREGAISSIQLLPIKRLSTSINLYFPPEQEEQIVQMLGTFVPQEVRSHSAIDHLMRKVRY